ncbi:hypothetical protein LTR84_003777 [Exophiala bonariae]|uniref:Uncharacterized protein n=1 Tax=Exophiala bonariae TaxID=1690606 RepID=A0AAV9N9T6_9EURO|nr:hypothetical protein LTR84_003777 [Exophiala bonariae]
MTSSPRANLHSAAHYIPRSHQRLPQYRTNTTIMAQQRNASHTQRESVSEGTEERRNETEGREEEEMPLPSQVEQFERHEDYQSRIFHANHIAKLMRTKAKLLKAEDLRNLSELIDLVLTLKLEEAGIDEEEKEEEEDILGG